MCKVKSTTGQENEQKTEQIGICERIRRQRMRQQTSDRQNQNQNSSAAQQPGVKILAHTKEIKKTDVDYSTV